MILLTILPTNGKIKMQNDKSKIKEAEEDTVESKLIVSSLKKAGFKMLGQGADATVWTKDQGQIIKIIMPDDENITSAAATFKAFYEFCNQHQNLDCLPKFFSTEGYPYLEFELGNKNYIQVTMEQLYHIRRNTFAEAMAYMLSEYATDGLAWEDVMSRLREFSTWSKSKHFANIAATLTLRMEKLSKLEQAKFSVLYSVMKLLYLTGQINRYGWDLHTDNIMQRKDGTLVITDPWFSIFND